MGARNIMEFKLKEQLPMGTQREIKRIEGVEEGLRTSREVAFLKALEPYVKNKVLKKEGDLILEAEGIELDKYSGFRKGAKFTLLGKTKKVYDNKGDEKSSKWSLRKGK